MKTRMAFALALVVTAGGIGQTQPQPKPGVVLPSPPLGDGVPPLSPIQPPPLIRSAAKDDTLAQLLDQLEQLQQQRVALAKREEALRQIIHKKLDEQGQRLKKLGLVPPPSAKEKEPDRVGRIRIVGNIKTPDKKILEQLSFVPGSILKYPMIEEAHEKLKKAGFRTVSVEVVANEFEPSFKDILVTVIESGR